MTKRITMKQLNVSLERLENKVEVISTDLNVVKTDLNVVKMDLSVVKTDLSQVKQDVHGLNIKFFNLHNSVDRYLHRTESWYQEQVILKARHDRLSGALINKKNCDRGRNAALVS